MKKEDIKIAVFSSFDKDGGSAIACYNSVRMLRDKGYYAIELVAYKTGNDSFVYEVLKERKQKTFFQRALNKILPQVPYRDVCADTDPDFRFFGDDSDYPEMCTVGDIEKSIPFIPNIIFVGHSYQLVNTRILAELHKKWGAHIYMLCTDISAYTGGCHVHWDCKGYTSGCEDCPAVLVKHRKLDVSEAFCRKRKNIVEGHIGLSYANNWLKREIERSQIYAGQTQFFIGQGTDIDLYNPNNRDIAKKIFSIDEDTKVVMNGSSSLNDKRKGFNYFCDAMNILWRTLSDEYKMKTILLIIGQNQEAVQALLDKLPPFNIKIVDFITDMRLMSIAYQATDVYVGTSLEDAGPMMVSDSLACGTPVVGFRTGFFADEQIVQDGVTGYSVGMKDTEMLAARIKDVLELSKKDFKIMSSNCREVAVNILSKYKTMERLDTLFSEL